MAEVAMAEAQTEAVERAAQVAVVEARVEVAMAAAVRV